MSAADGMVVGTTKIVDNGDATKRFNIVLVAEGYTNAQLGQFATDAQKFVDELFNTAPFNDLKCAINVYRIDVSSTDSGADDPAACGGTGATPATYFDASFCNGGIRRLLLVNNATVLNVVNAQVPQWHSVLVIVNSSVWGGAGGSIGTTSTAPGWEKIPIHEMGHAVFGFADEYEYWASCAEAGHDNYIGVEPAQPNVTANADRATIKWSSLILPATPMPTTDNADCGDCDPQPNPVAANTVGAFEGAKYYHCDIYRPQYDCMMRNLSPFCAVCRQEITNTLSPYLPVSGCYAPIFSKSSWFACIFKNLALLIAIIALFLLIWIPGIWCLIQKLFFKMGHCTVGNTNRCIKL